MNKDELRRRRDLEIYEHNANNRRHQTPITIAAECGYVIVILACMAWIATMIFNH